MIETWRSSNFVQARTRDGRPFRMLNVIEEFTRECLATDVASRLTSDDVLERLSDLSVRRGVPGHIRSDNGPKDPRGKGFEGDRRGSEGDRIGSEERIRGGHSTFRLDVPSLAG